MKRDERGRETGGRRGFDGRKAAPAALLLAAVVAVVAVGPAAAEEEKAPPAAPRAEAQGVEVDREPGGEPGSEGEGIPRSALRTRVRAVEGLGASSGDRALRDFVAEELAPDLARSMPEEELLDLVRRIRRLVAAAGEIAVAPEGETGARIALRGGESGVVALRLEAEPPHRIAALRLEDDAPARGSGGAPPRGWSWDDLEARLEEAEEAGFAGTVLAVRDGEVVLHRGFGLADREHGIPNTRRTIYGIGSTPIDFTRAAIFLLEQEGVLSVSDPITRFLPDVPQDQRRITLGHLLRGESGLPNFHHIPGEDADYDLSWIDRETAVRRILDRELLFAPGEGRSHSHSAFVLLAAIVEIASGTSYGDFLESRFFAPAGMERTGFYGSDLGLDEREFAVGYGGRSAGEVNSPPHWGPTSWLVMGSGGMVSTPGDMFRWVRAIESGEILAGDALEAYRTRGVLVGGSDRGFYFLYTVGFDDAVFVASNVLGRDGIAERVGRALAGLVVPEGTVPE